MTYVLSDIHGNSRRFQSILSQIDLQPEDTLYILGDIIDRFPDGGRLLRQIMKRSKVKVLLGNHELMMLDALRPEKPAEMLSTRNLWLWYDNGGEVTHRYLKHLRKTDRASLLEYVASLPLFFDVEVNGRKYKLVHAAPSELFREYGVRYRSEKEFAVWMRLNSTFYNRNDYTIVFGHTPTKFYQDDEPLKIWRGKRLLGIDCGSGYVDGRLACIRLEDEKEFYSEEVGNP